MSKGINKVLLIGNLGAEPESTTTNGGMSICKFRIATSESWRDKVSGELQERTEWHRITTFDRLAEICQQYLHKGSKVYIEGRIQTSKWQDNDGNDRYTTEIIAREMQMLDSRGGSGSAGMSAPANNSPSAENPTPTFQDDDIPF